MVGPEGAPPLPWLAEPLRGVWSASRGHALLLLGPSGVGQFELALALAQRWLCEAAPPDSALPCGRCAGCRLVLARSHPDLLVVLPEALRESLGWSEVGEGERGDDAKRKPSREIRVDGARLAIDFAQRTASRGGAKVVLIHPADAMNAIAANTLLKTLEEPPPALRFILCAAAADALPPTVRSRCQPWRLDAPARADSVAWLETQSVRDAEVLLAATGDRPLEALQWARDGIDGQAWLALPEAVRRGDARALDGWPVPRAIEAMQKLCHDVACVTAGASPRWLDAAWLRPASEPAALLRWSRELARLASHAAHPWHAPLLIETLVTQGRRALA